uniref:Uncharacterized protein n=1 Tax=Oryza sativa subsp. japonica TaxID=39947 RepID=Q6ZF54_ORYSJ|nr:hypothetical protein [Oryza sativa Japonica Group]BAD30103.1 hypothetical protein [Oryza sativa Japonica Group]
MAAEAIGEPICGSDTSGGWLELSAVGGRFGCGVASQLGVVMDVEISTEARARLRSWIDNKNNCASGLLHYDSKARLWWGRSVAKDISRICGVCMMGIYEICVAEEEE